MKAWYVTDKPTCTYAGIVFAETRGKAISYCVANDDVIGDVEFTDVIARRCKTADAFYNYKPIMDWYDSDDRILMVKELGFSCTDDMIVEAECECCPAKGYCDKWEEIENEKRGGN